MPSQQDYGMNMTSSLGGPITTDDPGSKPAANQDDEAQRDIKMCRDLMAQGKAARARFDADWEKRQHYYQGRQWSIEKYSSLYKSKPVLNIIRSTIQAQLPILTDNRPGFAVLPKEPSDYDFAQMLGELVDAHWENTGMDLVILEALMDEMIMDCGMLKCTWDPEAEDGAGEIKVECLNPFDVYVPYGAVDFGKNCPWVIHRKYAPTAELKKMFPEFKDKIKADAPQERSNNQPTATDEVKLVSPTDQFSPPGMGVPGVGFADLRSVAEVWEIWIKSDEYETGKDAQNNDVTKAKYPQGALITILPGQNLRLQKVKNPYSHGTWPFIRFIDTLLPREFYGEGEAKHLMQTQRLINKVLSHGMDGFNLMTNPVWLVEEGTGVTPDEISNQIASVIMTRPGSVTNQAIRRDFPPAMQGGIWDTLNMFLRMADMVSGQNEVSQGRHPPGVTAASAIENLQEAAQTRIRLKERNMQVGLQQLGKQMISLMMQYYKEPRVARITGKAGQWPTYFEFFIEEPEPGSYVFNKRQHTPVQNQITGKVSYQPDQTYSQTPMTKGVMDIKILSGTSMPWSKVSKANIAFRLYDSKVIDRLELLNALEWPNADKITQRLDQEQAAGEAQNPAQPPQPNLPTPSTAAKAGGG